MPVNIKITGIPNLQNAANNAKNAKGILNELLLKSAGDFATKAHKNITENYLTGPRPEKLAVVTGRLRSSIKFLIGQRIPETTIRFGSDVPYAAIHEYGGDAGRNNSVHMRSRSYLKPGVMGVLPEFQRDIQEILSKVANGITANG